MITRIKLSSCIIVHDKNHPNACPWSCYLTSSKLRYWKSYSLDAFLPLTKVVWTWVMVCLQIGKHYPGNEKPFLTTGTSTTKREKSQERLKTIYLKNTPVFTLCLETVDWEPRRARANVIICLKCYSFLFTFNLKPPQLASIISTLLCSCWGHVGHHGYKTQISIGISLTWWCTRSDIQLGSGTSRADRTETVIFRLYGRTSWMVRIFNGW